MKNLSYIIILLLLAGCSDDFFDLQDPSHFNIETYYQNEGHADKAVTACYANMQKQGFYFNWGAHWADQMSDEFFATGFAAGYQQWGSITSLDISADGAILSKLWEAAYEGVYSCNVAIEKIPGIKEFDVTFTQEKEDFYMGQAHFMRAWYYVQLYNFFGAEIPLNNKIAEGTDDYYPSVGEPDAIKNLIISDLKAAQNELPNVDEYRGTSNLGRASKGSATALLGKFYLFEKEWKNASDELAKVVNNQVGTYSLVDYHSMFNDENPNSNESIWELQFAELGGNLHGPNSDDPNQNEVQLYTISRSHNRYTNPNYWWNFSIRQDRAEGGRTNANEESGERKELWTFEKDADGKFIDNRVYATFWGVKNGAAYTCLGTVKTWNQQTWSPNPVEGYCYGARKYDRDTYGSNSEKQKDINIMFIRLSDVYLMYAEAKLMQGDESTAKAYIQKVRDRANLPMIDQAGMPNTFAGNLPSVDELMSQKGWSILEVLQHERYVELFSEGKRWWDIKRWDIGDETVGYKPGWPIVKTRNYLLPAPQGEIDNNPNYSGNGAN